MQQLSKITQLVKKTLSQDLEMQDKNLETKLKKLFKQIPEKLANYNELFSDFQYYHSNFQIENFIIKQENPTIWGQYKQALRELHSRFQNLISQYVNLEKLKLSIVHTEQLLQKYTTQDIKYQKLQLTLLHKYSQLFFQTESFKDLLRETDIFLQIVLKLKQEIQSKNKEQLEKEYWIEKFKEDVKDHIKAGMRPTIGLIRAIKSLSKEDQKIIFEELFRAMRDDLVSQAQIQGDALNLIKAINQSLGVIQNEPRIKVPK